MRIGFIGSGAITSAVVTGLSKSIYFHSKILLSPRSICVSAKLARDFESVQVAKSNQEVLDFSDVICTAVRPQVATELLKSLSFRSDHQVISFIATYSLEKLSRLLAAQSIVRAIPLPTISNMDYTTPIFPVTPAATVLFSSLGGVVALGNESELDAISAVTALMGDYFARQDLIMQWLTDRGVSAVTSRSYLDGFFKGLARTSANSASSYQTLIAEHMTKGGINKQLFRYVKSCQIDDIYRKALDATLERVQNSGS